MEVIKSKKGDINMSLSWIFMIILGSFFLIFAYNVIDKYQEIEDSKYSLELKQSMRTILNQIGKTSDSDQIKLEFIGNLFKDSKVEILCNENLPLLSINEDIDQNNQFLKNYPTFMTKIDEKKIPTTYIAVENFNMPFKITEMVAILSTKNVIILDSNLDLSDSLIKKFNRGAYREKIVPVVYDLSTRDVNTIYSEFKDNGPASIMFVTDESIDLDLSNIEIDAYQVKINTIDTKQGTITYSNGDSYPYYDNDNSYSLITMAIFSSPDAFKCSYNLLMEKIPYVYNFYKEKTEILRDEGSCSASIDESSKNLKYDALNTALNDVIGVNFINLENLKSNIEEVESSLKDLEAYSCTYVY